jgi:OOP family OmpA-OmpF porin
MKKIALILFILLQYNYTYSQQNLVLNGSFEDYYSCPTLSSYDISLCKYVFNPCGSTSDYFNSCADFSTSVSTPKNIAGYQIPKNGNSYVGIVISYIDDFQEYVQIKLINPLVKNKTYSFSLYTVLAKRCGVATSNIGIKFVNDSTQYSCLQLSLFSQPDWQNPKRNYIKDTVNWVELSGKYNAKGGENYIIIGCFRGGSNLDTVIFNPTGGAPYYLIDDVKIIEENENIFIPELFTPNNDGYNDEFEIKLSGYEKCNIYIYNRWGNEVYQNKMVDVSNHTRFNAWDGTFKNKKLPTGTYYYLIELYSKEKIINVNKGFIQLIN